jgi:YegS/Rv2252/BmrU family lipid kinase
VRVAVIINPVSGFTLRRDTGRRRAEQAMDVLVGCGVRPEVLVSERAGHLFELARGAVERGATRVIAWGGDGSINEVSRALAFTSTPMAIVPAGSGNGLARALGVPMRTTAALHSALSSAVHPIDLGEIDKRLFANIAGVGFDAHVAHAFNSGSRGRGLQGYARLVTSELFTYRPRQYRLRVDQAETNPKAFLLTIANGPQWGNGARIAPDARLDDGLLDVVIAETSSALQAVTQVPRLFTGTIMQARGVSLVRGRHVSIEANEPLCLHVDGEAVPVDSMRLEARVHPAALLVCS